MIRLGLLDSVDVSDRAVMSLRLAVGGRIYGQIRPCPPWLASVMRFPLTRSVILTENRARLFRKRLDVRGGIARGVSKARFR